MARFIRVQVVDKPPLGRERVTKEWCIDTRVELESIQGSYVRRTERYRLNGEVAPGLLGAFKRIIDEYVRL